MATAPRSAAAPTPPTCSGTGPTCRPRPPAAADTAAAPWYADTSPTGDDPMPPTLAAPAPAVFPADVLAFAAERGVTEYLVPLYDLAKRWFDGADVTVTFESDYEIPGLSWIVYQVDAGQWEDDRRRTAYYRYTDEKVRKLPPSAREPFAMRVL